VIAVAPVLAQEEYDPDKETQKVLDTKTITLNMSDTSVENVLSFLEDISGLKFVLDEKSNTGQTVTVVLSNVTLKSALTTLAEQAGLTYGLKEGVIHVATKERLAQIMAGDEKKEYTLRSGLQKGQEMTCRVTSKMRATEGEVEEMNANMEFDVELEVADVAEDGTARLKGEAKGKAAMKGPMENETRPIEKKMFESDISGRWGFRATPGLKFICPGFEPLADILPERAVKVGDKWDVNLTRSLATFLFMFMNMAQAEGADEDEMQQMMVQQMLQTIGMFKAPTVLTLTEVRDNIAVIKGELKSVDFAGEKGVRIDDKKTEILLEFDMAAGVMTLFSSKLRLLAPEGEEGVADVELRQEFKVKAPREEPEYADADIRELCGKSDIVAGVEVVAYEERGEYNYYVVKVLSDVKGAEGRQHLDLLATPEMDLDKGDRFIMFLACTEVSGRKMLKLVDPEKGYVKHTDELLKKVTELAGGSK
jgi:hypothetical protein